MQTSNNTKTRSRCTLSNTDSQFPSNVIRFDSRPRLKLGDVVEICRGCLPCNLGKLAIIERFVNDGVIVRALSTPFETVDIVTRENAGTHMTLFAPTENLYRRNNALAKKEKSHV